MTGLEKIISKIAQDSEEKCSLIISNAEKEAEEIKARARAESKIASDKIISDAEEKAKQRNSVSKSNADTITRNRYLEAKNAIINDIVSAAYEEIANADDSKYFSFLHAICVKYVAEGECILYLNSRDLARLPSKFEISINSEVYEKAAVQISKTPKNIPNGFILDYGDFEIDCTLKSVFDEKMSLIKEMLSEILFKD